MKFKKLSCALTASLMLHTAIVLLIGAYWVTKTPQPDDTITVAFLSEQAPPKQKMRKPAIAGRVSAIGTQPSPHAERRPPVAMKAVSNYQPTSVLEFSSKVARVDSPIAMRVDSLTGSPAPTPGASRSDNNAPSNLKPQTSSTPTNMVAAMNRVSADGQQAAYRHAPRLKPPNAAAYPDMYFKGSGVNPFLDTEDEHLSTFAMDVDTASYSVTRRYLTEGHLPPSEAVRVEEFVNAFKYDYADTDRWRIRYPS